MIPIAAAAMMLHPAMGGLPRPHLVPKTHTAPVTAAHKPHKAAAPHKVTTDSHGLYDSTTPSSIPHGKNQAVYSDGAYAASASAARGHHTLWIDTNASDPHANVLDVEPGDATPAQSGHWAHDAHKDHPQYPVIVYTMKSDYSQVRSAVNHDAPASHVKFWIADPTGTPHMVGGATATQWSWGANVDTSSTLSTLWTP